MGMLTTLTMLEQEEALRKAQAEAQKPAEVVPDEQPKKTKTERKSVTAGRRRKTVK